MSAGRGAGNGPQWERLLRLRAGEVLPLVGSGLEQFMRAGCRKDGEAKSDNLWVVNLVTGALIAREHPSLRPLHQLHAADYFATQDRAWCQDEFGATTYQMLTVSALHCWLDIADRWAAPLIERVLAKHSAWCKLHEDWNTRQVVSAGYRCGTDHCQSRSTWHFQNEPKWPLDMGWRKWVKYEWARTMTRHSRFPDGEEHLRIDGEVTIERGRDGHVSTLTRAKTKHGSPPPLYRAQSGDVGPILERIVIDRDGVHRNA